MSRAEKKEKDPVGAGVIQNQSTQELHISQALSLEILTCRGESPKQTDKTKADKGSMTRRSLVLKSRVSLLLLILLSGTYKRKSATLVYAKRMISKSMIHHTDCHYDPLWSR